MKKFKVTLASVVISTSAAAADIEAVFHYPAGAGHDTATAALWTAVENSGVKVKKVYYKSCAEAIDYVKRTPNSLFISDNGSFKFDQATNLCPAADANNIKFVSLVLNSGAYLCTAPKQPNLTMKDLTTDRVYKIAAVKHISSSNAVEAFLKSINSKSRVIPYANNAEFRAAVISGDVDFAFGINGIPELVAAGGKCLAGTTTPNLRNLPPLSNFSNNQFPEFSYTLALFTAHPNPEFTKILQQAMKTPEFQKNVADRQGIHMGLGTSTPVDQQKQNYINNSQAMERFK